MNFLLDTNIYFAAIHDAGFLARHRDDLLRIVRAERLQGANGDLGRAGVSR